MTKHVLHIEADTMEELGAAAVLAVFKLADLVPPAGIEPAHPEVPDFESGASTNSAKGATAARGEDPKLADVDAMGTASSSTIRQYTEADILAGEYPETTLTIFRQAERFFFLNCSLCLPNGWLPEFHYDTRGYWYFQVECDEGTCNVTGEPLSWRGRKWLISEHMTDSEIVQTVFKAVMTAMEHEVREQFRYNGQSIFDPHYDIEKLVALRRRPDALSERA